MESRCVHIPIHLLHHDVVHALTTTFEIGGCAVSSLSADVIVGYKGGTIERQLLIEIGMYRYDIGALGCPKTDVVLAAMGAIGRLGDPCHECARYQRYRKDGKLQHSPVIETRAMRNWLIDWSFADQVRFRCECNRTRSTDNQV